MAKVTQISRKKLAYIFLEGKTEDVFYKKISDKYLKGIPKKYTNLKTGTNINIQIVSHLYNFIIDSNNSGYDIYVYAFIDKEGTRTGISNFNSTAILNKLKEQIKVTNVKNIMAIEAVYMIESWFFYDLQGICRYIDIPYTLTLRKNYSNPEVFKDIHLSELFKKGKSKKFYKKGDGRFLDLLDITKIYDNCIELKNGVEQIVRDFK